MTEQALPQDNEDWSQLGLELFEDFEHIVDSTEVPEFTEPNISMFDPPNEEGAE